VLVVLLRTGMTGVMVLRGVDVGVVMVVVVVVIPLNKTLVSIVVVVEE